MNVYDQLMNTHPSNILLLSDTHLYDENIIVYENWIRRTWYDMILRMETSWDKCTYKNSLVIHLGDVCDKKANIDDVKRAFDHMHGTKVLVLGNHDRDRPEAYWKKIGFDYVIPYPIILKDFFILSHEPIYSSRNTPMVNIHGHVHGDTKYTTVSSHSYCVCPERNDYSPVSLQYIMEKIEEYRSKE